VILVVWRFRGPVYYDAHSVSFYKNPVHAKENIEMQFNVGKHTSPKRFYSICFYMKIFQVNIKSI
ncbi:hypothetical protein, partial [Escherichia coli]|uniref:hypothetical protein n=1 Tax=Escherichia coli TaxID=562 RepID=UPI001BC8AFD7